MRERILWWKAISHMLGEDWTLEYRDPRAWSFFEDWADAVLYDERKA
jgi:hypothetical protein